MSQQNLFHDSDSDSDDEKGVVVSWYKKQAQAFGVAEKLNNSIHIKRGLYEFGSVSNQDEFVELILESKEAQRLFHEQVVPGQACRMFCDLDGDGICMPKAQFFAQFNALMADIFEAVDGLPKFNVRHVRLAVSEGEKLSGHWSYIGATFPDITAQKQFWKYVESVIYQDWPDLAFFADAGNGQRLMTAIDTAVYRKNGTLRAVMCTKKDEERALIPMKIKQKPLRLRKIKHPSIAEYFLHDPGSSATYDLSIPRIIKAKTQTFDLDELTQIILDAVPDVTAGEWKGRMLSLVNDGTRTCVIGGEDNDGDNSYAVVGMKEIYYHCHDEECAGKRKVIYEFPRDKANKASWSDLRAQGWKADTKELVSELRDDVVEFINSQFTVITHSSRTIIISVRNENKSEISGRSIPEVDYMTKESVMNSLANKNIPTQFELVKGKPIIINAFETWWKSPQRLEKARFAFEPYIGQPPAHVANCCNMWTGFDVTAGDCEESKAATLENSELLRHIRERWCAGEEHLYQWVMGWLATILQRPWYKPKSTIVLQAREGAGKGLPIQVLAKIMGVRYFFQPSDSDEVLGSFNADCANKKMIFMDEMVWGGEKRKAGVLKKLITEETFTAKQKFLPNISGLKQVAGIIIASNEGWVVPAGLNARRYLVLKCSDELSGVGKKKRKLIERLVNYVEDPAKILEFAKTLYAWDLSEFNDRDPPQTEGLRHQKIMSFSPEIKFIHSALNSGEIQGINGIWQFGERSCGGDIHKQYKSECSHPLTSKIFWTKMQEAIGGDYSRSKSSRTGGGVKKLFVDALPSLEDARAAFRQFVGDKDWSFDEIMDDGESDSDSDEE